VICLDASALVDWLLQTPGRGGAVAERMRAAGAVNTLDLAAVEVVSALRRKLRRNELTPMRAETALWDLAHTPLRWHPAAPLTRRVWELRETHTAFDAAYVALAEVLGMPLLTTDSRLARAHGHGASVIDASEST
jgi:predicted nucleic acid-binding protein